MLNTPRLRLKFLAIVAATVTAVASLSACGDGEAVGGQATRFDTVEPGVITVTMQPYAPYTSLVGGKFEGLDADILNIAAKNLGMKIKPVVTDFKGMLGSVQSHRADISVGGITWTEERQAQGLFTDPVYYSPPAMAVVSGKSYETIEDLHGLTMGTVDGYVWADAISQVPNAKLKTYPTAAALFDDLAAKRIDVAWIDPLLMLAAQKAGKDMETEYLKPPTAEQVAAHPKYTAFQPYQVAFYVPKAEPKLAAAISKEIRAMYEDGTMSELIKKYGGDPDQFLKRSPELAKARIGVDRPSDWVAPTI